MNKDRSFAPVAQQARDALPLAVNDSPGEFPNNAGDSGVNAQVRNKADTESLRCACPVRERSDVPVIRARELAYVVFQRPDIEQASRFFCDFGLLVEHREKDAIYLRGIDTRHIALVLRRGPEKMLGLGIVATRQDLEVLAAHLNTEVEVNDGKLGGEKVGLTDPNELQLDICSELHQLGELRGDEDLPWNNPGSKPRSNQAVRTRLRPHPVNKLGHCVIGIARLRESVEWYQDKLGMIVSDFQFFKNEALPAVAFMRFDRGQHASDHHSLGLASVIETGHMHSAFEMESFEKLAVSNEWMKNRGYLHSWGIGRHILGSQIFDYWREPRGDLFEHYVDGDVFDSTKETGYHFLSAKAQHQWGPEQSKDFTGQNRFRQIFRSLIRRLPGNDDLTLRRIRNMLKAISS